jgi:hypothetical protein
VRGEASQRLNAIVIRCRKASKLRGRPLIVALGDALDTGSRPLPSSKPGPDISKAPATLPS